MMLYGYFDDSNTHGATKTVTMAGYIAPLENWRLFERASNDFFRREGIGRFHAKDFDKRSGDFKGSTLVHQLRFATEWFDIARETVMCGYAIGIDKADYNQAKSETRLAQSISPYGYCFKILLRKICKNGALWDQICSRGLHLIIEHGNTGNAGLSVDFEAMLRENGPLNGRVKSLSFAKKDDCRAIQLADYLAYYSGRDTEIYSDCQMPRDRPYLDIALQCVPTDYALCSKFVANPDY